MTKAKLGQIQEPKRRGKIARPPNVPEVAVFFVLDGELRLDGVPWTECEDIAGFVNHPRSHEQLWRTYQGTGAAPLDMDYDEVARGRVIFNANRHEFYLFADRCILRDRIILDRIKSELRLPFGVEGQPDAHYRCPKCLRVATTDED